ncbi:CPBP family intramembrane metalloprotease domain-containing protein [Lactobacillus sp. CBA3606]|uniref:CPBP family intramembrane glutamic endopeptidase n=1 Tax=Lactobacillus sp. CBA3606 TaxID=2099789 RepID=UPI000CFACA37|nr:CPBP family intramembrane glutamic endopeptidase [Lactobacillus sp. CBA3606]AVK63707.1 CPBP family intramembrane metalloprotease domain-containing protein [Lactobacillus sp. CBA3606]
MTPYVERSLRRWYLWQLIGLVGAVFVNLFMVGGNSFDVGGMLLIMLVLGAVLPTFETQPLATHWRRFRRFNHYFQTIVQFLSLPLLVANLILMLSKVSFLDQQGLVAVGFALLMVLFVPVAYVVTRPIESVLGRILMLISVIFSGVLSAQMTMLELPGLTAPAVFKLVGNSGILGALGFVVTVGVLMRSWQFNWPTWRLQPRVNWGQLAFIGILAGFFVIWNAYGVGSSWATAFTTFDFHMKSVSWQLFLGGLEPGIAEEWLYRFAVLALLLRAFKARKHQLEWAIFLSSGLFGAWHLTNILSGQALSATLEQMIFAAALGCFLAVSYLYSGSLLVPIVIHALTDILSMMASGSQTMTKPDLFEWETLAFLVLVFGLVTGYLLTGSRRRLMQSQVDNRLHLKA